MRKSSALRWSCRSGFAIRIIFAGRFRSTCTFRRVIEAPPPVSRDGALRAQPEWLGLHEGVPVLDQPDVALGRPASVRAEDASGRDHELSLRHRRGDRLGTVAFTATQQFGRLWQIASVHPNASIRTQSEAWRTYRE